MTDVHLLELAARQRNRISRRQALDLDFDAQAIQRRLDSGRLVAVEEGVYAFAPVVDDDLGRWLGATLTAAETYLSHWSAGAALGLWSLPRSFESVTRPGNGGPRQHGGLRVFRSSLLDGNTTQLGGIPITTCERTLLDLASHVSDKGLARAVRDAVRLELTTLPQIGDALGRHLGRRGTRRLALVISRYSGLPLERARSGAEIRALEVLRAAGVVLPELNVRIAGEEADLSWARWRRIVEIDGKPFHLDRGEDARKRSTWEFAGWQVDRIDANDVYDHPELLLALAPPEAR